VEGCLAYGVRRPRCHGSNFVERGLRGRERSGMFLRTDSTCP
jgi:hypothetical protein